MAEIVNLRRVRKAKNRAAQDARAEENRVKFGRTAAEKHLEAARDALSVRKLDGHKRVREDSDKT